MSHLAIVPPGETASVPTCLADLVDAPTTVEDLERQMHEALGDAAIYLKTPQIIGFGKRSDEAPELYQDLGYLRLRYVGVRGSAERAVVPVTQMSRTLGRISTVRSELVLFSHASSARRKRTVARYSPLLGVGIFMPVELARTLPSEPTVEPTVLRVVH